MYKWSILRSLVRRNPLLKNLFTVWYAFKISLIVLPCLSPFTFKCTWKIQNLDDYKTLFSEVIFHFFASFPRFLLIHITDFMLKNLLWMSRFGLKRENVKMFRGDFRFALNKGRHERASDVSQMWPIQKMLCEMWMENVFQFQCL